MARQTYYMVQVSSVAFVRKDEHVGYGTGYGTERAAHMSLVEAQRVYREHKRLRNADTPRRFPRIIKVTVETKTITPNN